VGDDDGDSGEARAWQAYEELQRAAVALMVAAAVELRSVGVTSGRATSLLADLDRFVHENGG
jgi:hypothetical protein